VTETLPALPEALASLETTPPSTIDKVLAVTATGPAFPLPEESPKMPAGYPGVPFELSIVSGPDTLTDTRPLFPGPSV
jgi:hypothetical protein